LNIENDMILCGQPLVSIITPVYNGERYLEETILSVLNQNYQNIEYIIIDGGSDDNTINIIKKYEKNITYWISEPDNGMYDAINKGLRVASGEIETYLNYDDVYNDNKTIEKIVAKFLTNSIDFLYSDQNFIDEKSNLIYRYKYPNNISKKIYCSLNWSSLAQPTVFWKKTLRNKIGLFNSEFKNIGDFEFFCRVVLNAKKATKLDFCIASTRLHGDNKSKNYTEVFKEMSILHEMYPVQNKSFHRIVGELLFKIKNLNTILYRLLFFRNHLSVQKFKKAFIKI
jgi:glycosyltransferase involved in cell wall biosynthesis